MVLREACGEPFPREAISALPVPEHPLIISRYLRSDFSLSHESSLFVWVVERRYMWRLSKVDKYRFVS